MPRSKQMRKFKILGKPTGQQIMPEVVETQ